MAGCAGKGFRTCYYGGYAGQRYSGLDVQYVAWTAVTPDEHKHHERGTPGMETIRMVEPGVQRSKRLLWAWIVAVVVLVALMWLAWSWVVEEDEPPVGAVGAGAAPAVDVPLAPGQARPPGGAARHVRSLPESG